MAVRAWKCKTYCSVLFLIINYILYKNLSIFLDVYLFYVCIPLMRPPVEARKENWIP